MISRRNFLTISVMMFVVFFLFVFTGAAKLVFSNATVNEYNGEDVAPAATYAVQDVAGENDLLYLGDDEEIYWYLMEWAVYQKRNVERVPHGISYQSREEMPSMLVVDGASMQPEDTRYVLQANYNHLTVCFATPPTGEFLNAYPKLANIMGVRGIQQQEVELDGIHLYDGFLLGGERIYQPSNEKEEKYQDFLMTVPWFILNSSTNVYMDGLLEGDFTDVSQAYTPPLLWRHNTGGGDYVYVVNSDLMQHLSALGIYSAVEATKSGIYIYPVVNAQSFVLANFPSFAQENEEEIAALYSRKPIAYIENILWPSLGTIIETFHAVPTYFISEKVEETTEGIGDQEALEYMMQLMNERHGEAGLSLKNSHTSDPEKKLLRDMVFFDVFMENYRFYSAYIDDMEPAEAERLLDETGIEKIGTYVGKYEEGLPLLSSPTSAMMLRDTSIGEEYSYRRDFTVKSVETALGYSLVLQDMTDYMYPPDHADHLNDFFSDYAGSVNTLYGSFDKFEETSVTDAGKRVRQFFNATYSVAYHDEDVEVHADVHQTYLYFVLRCPEHKVTAVEGGKFEKLEDGAYLIAVGSPDTKIYLKDDSGSFFSSKAGKGGMQQ